VRIKSFVNMNYKRKNSHLAFLNKKLQELQSTVGALDKHKKSYTKKERAAYLKRQELRKKKQTRFRMEYDFVKSLHPKCSHKELCTIVSKRLKELDDKKK